MSGPYKNTGGPTSVVCCKQAVEEFGVAAKGINVEVMTADHQNKPDLAVVHRAPVVRSRRRGRDPRRADIVRGARRAVASCARRTRSTSTPAPPASDLTGKPCTPNFIHWVYDTYMLAKSTGGAMVKAGGDSWYFITADYAFGKQLQSRHHRFRHRPPAARCSAAGLSVPGHHATSRRSWCRRRRAAPRCSGWPTPAPTR